MHNLKQLRENKDITQVELAEKLNVNQSTISMWERKRVMPRADKLPEIANVLGCTINDLFEEIGG